MTYKKVQNMDLWLVFNEKQGFMPCKKMINSKNPDKNGKKIQIQTGGKNNNTRGKK